MSLFLALNRLTWAHSFSTHSYVSNNFPHLLNRGEFKDTMGLNNFSKVSLHFSWRKIYQSTHSYFPAFATMITRAEKDKSWTPY